MSFMLTTEQMYNKTKTVTRRLGWKFLKAGDVIQAVEKCQGLKKGEKIKKICEIRILDNRQESLSKMDLMFYGMEETIKEGFTNMTPAEFQEMFCDHNKCSKQDLINRIEFEFVK